jgi:hypothetical protein
MDTMERNGRRSAKKARENPPKLSQNLRVRVPHNLYTALEAEADSRFVPVSQVVRELLRDWCKARP